MYAHKQRIADHYERLEQQAEEEDEDDDYIPNEEDNNMEDEENDFETQIGIFFLLHILVFKIIKFN